MDLSRNARQDESVLKWFNNNCMAGIVAATGFGKTTIAIKCIIELLKNKADLKCIVVVPTLILKSQWEAVLSNNGLLPFTQVLIINTAYKNNYDCDFLILDEAHTVPAEQFKNCLTTIKYKYLLWLTATIERLDAKENVLLSIAPICDTITLKECLAKNWVSDYKVYNLAVPLNKQQEEEYIKANKAFRFYAMKCGYSGNAFQNATLWLKVGSSEQKGLALAYYNSMRKRKLILSSNVNKVQVTLDIINKFVDRKGLLFSENIDFIESIYKLLPINLAIIIHSKMTKKKQLEALNNFKEYEFYKFILSCKGLVSGMDLPELDLGIIASANSSKITSIQSIGRLIRKKPDKQAIIINLYTPHGESYKSQEVSWVNKRQEGQENIQWITNLDEII